MVERTIDGKRLRMVRGDITEVEVEAFVFDITEDAKLGSGFGGAIQQRGGIVIQKELDEIGSVPKGEAVVTQVGILNAEFDPLTLGESIDHIVDFIKEGKRGWLCTNEASSNNPSSRSSLVPRKTA